MPSDDAAELQALFAELSESVAVYGLDSSIVYLNAAAERALGEPLERLRGQRLFERFSQPAEGSSFQKAFERVVAGGESESFELYFGPWDAWFSGRVARVGQRVHAVWREVTEDVRRRRRIETLGRISEVVTQEALELSSATKRIAQILAAELAADCSLALLSQDGEWLELAGSAWHQPAVEAPVPGPSRWDARIGQPGQALRMRVAILAQADSLAEQTRAITDTALRAAIERYGPGSLLVVPLLVGDEALGVLLAVRRQREPPLSEDERVLAASIAPSLCLLLAHARRQSEASSLRERLEHLADALPALVAFVDREQRYQYVNAAYEHWFKAPRETFVGRTIREMAPAGVYERIEPQVRRALSGAAVRYQGRFEYPTGSRDVDVQYLPIQTPRGIDGLGVLVRDVTAEVRVAESEREQLEVERRATRRLESLLSLAGKLAAAATPEQVARVVVDEGVAVLEASMAGMFLLSENGRELQLMRERGFSADQVAAFRRVPLETNGPLPDAIRSGRPVWIASREEYAARYPELEPQHRPEPAPPIAFAIMPYFVAGQVAGCSSFVFHDERRLTAADRTYLEVLTSHSAEALRRARIWRELRDVSETRAAMIRASPAAIMLLDEAGVVHAYNPAAERIFGWSAAEVLGRVLPAAEDNPDEFTANLQHVLQGNVIRREARRTRRNGEWFDLELYAAPVGLSDGRTLYLSIFVDITDRKRAERGRQLLADASAVLSQPVALTDSLAKLVRLPLGDFADLCSIDLLTEGLLERIALSRGQGDARQPRPQRVAHDPARGGVSLAIETREPQLVSDLDDAARRRLAGEGGPLEAPVALALRATLSVPLLVGQRVLGALSFGSCRRNFDALDLEIAGELARHVATGVENTRLFEDAKRARTEAEAANRTKDEFLAMLGHELRNPLAPIVTALELMQLREPVQLVREREIIARQVGHLSRLVDDLLDVSRITRGKVELRAEHVGLGALVNKALEMTQPLLESRQQRVLVDIDPSLVVFADATRLSQVVANLLSNAAKYTPPGGQIEVRASAEPQQVVLSVRDNGVGIAREMLPRIFEIFMQAPQPSARTEGGLGIGLAIVKSLVAAHGGSVEARSDGPGRGAELIVRLPAPEARAVAPPQRAAPLARAGDARRVLLVDDNEDAANMLAEFLELQGHEVAAAYDGPSALQLAESFLPDVAILDLGLPVMDGYELARRLLSARRIRLIAVTGYGRDSDRERALAAGFEAHLAKPVALDALLRLVDQNAEER